MDIVDRKTESFHFSCNHTEYLPLFGNTSCVSRTIYTGILLTSIILSGVSFLIITILLFMTYFRPLTSMTNDTDSSVYTDTTNETVVYRTNKNVKIARVLETVITRLSVEQSDNKTSEYIGLENLVIKKPVYLTSDDDNKTYTRFKPSIIRRREANEMANSSIKLKQSNLNRERTQVPFNLTNSNNFNEKQTTVSY